MKKNLIFTPDTDGIGFTILQCVDCGAYALDTKEPNDVDHHATCVTGESERWAKHYAEDENNDTEYPI